MARGRARARKRPLTRAAAAILALLLPAGLLHAQAGPRVVLDAPLEGLAAGSAWTLTVLTDHHDPGQVIVTEPQFPAGLYLEQVLHGPRLVSPDAGRFGAGRPGAAAGGIERWTATEYRFYLRGGGTLAFDSFTVTTPRGQARTLPFSIEVRGEEAAGARQAHRAQWLLASGLAADGAGLETGKTAEIYLRLGEGRPDAAPPPQAFMPEAPEGHILEPIPIPAGEAARGTVLALRVVPLEPGYFALGARAFARNGAAFEIPALRMPVARAAGGLAGGLAGRAPAQRAEPPEAAAAPPPFPPRDGAEAASPRLFRRHRGEFEAAYLAALGLWESGRRACALAALRQSERDSRAGAPLAAVRREAEAALGITGARSERRRPPWDRAPRAVLRETAVRRVPDLAGEEIARFPEGQPVTINRESPGGRAGGPGWALVTGDGNGTSGWIPADKIIQY